MTRIAVLSDIHGNVPALEAVLTDLDRQRVDEVLVGGDMVGRGPQGSQVVRRIARLGWPSVRGNHEDYLLGFHRREVPADWLVAEQWAASRWMAAELAASDVELISALPLTLNPRLAPDLLLVHGSPSSNNEGLGPWTPNEHLELQLREVDGELLVCAHTHRPMLRPVRGGMVVNVGSVGLPFNRDRRAQYAVFERPKDRGWQVELRQVAYDLRQTLAIYESSGFLAAGRVTARLLRLELEQAAPFLVPFLRWAAAIEAEPEVGLIPEFLRFYDPDEELGLFYRRLREGEIGRRRRDPAEA